MENLYDDLENYEDENIIEDLKNENCELKKKLQQYSSTVNQLQIDFDKLSSEYKQLELNYSSLLKTARAEIERKSKMITQLNVEKDMMIIQAFKSKGKQSFKNLSCNKDVKPMKTEISLRPKNEEKPCKSFDKQTPGHIQMCAIDSKENILDSKQRTTSKNITSNNKSLPVLSQFNEPIHRSKDQRLQGDESADTRSKTKPSDTLNYEDKYSRHKASASTKSDNERYYTINSYRLRDKSRHRRKSPKRISRHRSRSPRLRSRSPPADRFRRRKSRDRRNNCYDSEPSAAREVIPVNHIEPHALKHKSLPHAEEPGNKKIRVDSYGTYPRYERSSREGEFLSFSPPLMSPEDPVKSCQSPDYLNYDVDQSLIKEIIHTAIAPQDDPRVTSKKYIVQTENGKEFLKSISSHKVCLQQVDPLHWGIPRVRVPDALLKKPSNLHTEDNLLNYSKTNHIGLGILPDSMQDDRSESNSKVHSSESITEKSVTTSEIVSHMNKHSHHSTNNAEFQSLLVKSPRGVQAKTLKNNIPFISDTDSVPNLVSISTIEGDLLLSDEASDNADKAPISDQTTSIEMKPTKSSKNTLANQWHSICSETKMKKRDEVTDRREEIDNHKSVKKGGNPISLDGRDKSNILVEKEECREDMVLTSKDTESDINTTVSLETMKVEATQSNMKETSKVCKTDTSMVELEVVPHKTKSINNDKVTVEISNKIKNKLHSEETINMATKNENPKQYQESKRRPCPAEKSVDKRSKETVNNKKNKKNKFGERDSESTMKDNSNIEDTTIVSDSKRKFCELFGESSNSLIMPEDLGIKNKEAAENVPPEFASACDDTQSAVDLNLDNVSKNGGSSPTKEHGDTLLNGTVVCRDPQSPEKSNMFENIEPAVSLDSADVVIISTGVQSKLSEEPTALATSTPLKPDHRSQVPDVRIFVKRRRKIKKP